MIVHSTQFTLRSFFDIIKTILMRMFPLIKSNFPHSNARLHQKFYKSLPIELWLVFLLNEKYFTYLSFGSFNNEKMEEECVGLGCK